jgi:hypothetical protein
LKQLTDEDMNSNHRHSKPILPKIETFL